MGPSQKELPSTRKGIAKASFGLDISENEPSDDHVRPIASQLLTTSEIKERNEVTLLTLPSEIRLRIYNYLLINRFERTIFRHMIRAPRYRTTEPSILGTCKKIYQEGISILYTQNVFEFDKPEQMFQLNVQIGIKNFKLIRSLIIWVPCMAKLSLWPQLLHMLAKQASGLRHMELTWAAETEPLRQFERGDPRRGLGDNLHFVRALGKIQGLETLVIKGFYAIKWLAYLRERMGEAQVLAVRGDYFDGVELSEEGLVGKELKIVRFINKWEMEAFTKYQQGTEDLIP